MPLPQWRSPSGGGHLSRFMRWFNQRHLLKHLLIILVSLVAIVVGNWLLGQYADSITKDWEQHVVKNIPEKMVFPAETPITTEEQARLAMLFDTIRERRTLHLKIMNYYYARFFTAIILFSITGALTAILLVILGKGGWDAAKWNMGTGLIFTAFFIMAAATVYYNSWPGVFQLEKNIGDNKVLLLQYMALEQEILTYAVTNEALNYTISIDDLQKQPIPTEVPITMNDDSDPNSEQPSTSPQQTIQIGRPMSAKEFIHYVDLRLAKDNVAIGFDYNQVPNYENIFGTQ